MRRNHLLDEQDLRARCRCRTDVAKDSHRVLVGPVVDDVLEDVGVAAGRYLVEERTSFDPNPVRDTVFGKQVGGSGNHVAKVEQDATGLRRRRQDRGQQPAMSATDVDVDDGPSAAEVIGGDHRRDRQFRRTCHGLVEDFGERRFAGEIVEERFAVQCRDNRVAAAHRIRQPTPVVSMSRSAHKSSHPGQRHVSIAAKSFRQRGQCVAAVAALPEDAAPDQGTSSRLTASTSAPTAAASSSAFRGPLASTSTIPRSAATVIA